MSGNVKPLDPRYYKKEVKEILEKPDYKDMSVVIATLRDIKNIHGKDFLKKMIDSL